MNPTSDEARCACRSSPLGVERAELLFDMESYIGNQQSCKSSVKDNGCHEATMMRPTTPAILRPVPALGSTSLIARPFFVPRRFATTHQTSNTPESKRRAVTPFNDDGHVPWTNLSSGEKTGRAVQQTFNFGMVIVGLVMTGGVGYFLYTEVFSTDSKVAYFNRAVNRIKKDPRCLEMLGDSKKITAYGEETNNKWRRARPIA